MGDHVGDHEVVLADGLVVVERRRDEQVVDAWWSTRSETDRVAVGPAEVRYQNDGVVSEYEGYGTSTYDSGETWITACVSGVACGPFVVVMAIDQHYDTPATYGYPEDYDRSYVAVMIGGATLQYYGEDRYAASPAGVHDDSAHDTIVVSFWAAQAHVTVFPEQGGERARVEQGATVEDRTDEFGWIVALLP